jgi:hypothetical protein
VVVESAAGLAAVVLAAVVLAVADSAEVGSVEGD